MLHPVTDLVGIRARHGPWGQCSLPRSPRYQADRAESRAAGPAPFLFSSNSLIVICLIAFAIGFLVIGVRAASIPLSTSCARFLRLGGIAAARFAPDAGFIDMEQVWMQFVGIAAIVIAGGLLDLFF